MPDRVVGFTKVGKDTVNGICVWPYPSLRKVVNGSSVDLFI